MNKKLFLICAVAGIVTLMLVLDAMGQGVIPNTSFTRDLLRSSSASAARGKLGVTDTNGAVNVQTNGTLVTASGTINLIAAGNTTISGNDNGGVADITINSSGGATSSGTDTIQVSDGGGGLNSATGLTYTASQNRLDFNNGNLEIETTGNTNRITSSAIGMVNSAILSFLMNGSAAWTLETDGDLHPVGDITRDFGSITEQIKNAYANAWIASNHLAWERASDPSAVANAAGLYAKEDGGVTKLYAIWSDSTVVGPLGSGGGGGASPVGPDNSFQLKSGSSFIASSNVVYDPAAGTLIYSNWNGLGNSPFEIHVNAKTLALSPTKVGTTTTTDLDLYANNLLRWRIQQGDGDLLPNGPQDIASPSEYIDNIYSSNVWVEFLSMPQAKGNEGTIDAMAGQRQYYTVVTDTNLTVVNLTSNQAPFEVVFVQDDTGGHTVTLSHVLDPGSTNQARLPTVNTNAGYQTFVSISMENGLTNGVAYSANDIVMEKMALGTLTSDQFLTKITDETGSGSLVGSDGGTLSAPTISDGITITSSGLTTSGDVTNFVLDVAVARQTITLANNMHFTHATNLVSGGFRDGYIRVWTGGTDRGLSYPAAWNVVDPYGGNLTNNHYYVISFSGGGASQTNMLVAIKQF